jgi:hypothetical protein
MHTAGILRWSSTAKQDARALEQGGRCVVEVEMKKRGEKLILMGGCLCGNRYSGKRHGTPSLRPKLSVEDFVLFDSQPERMTGLTSFLIYLIFLPSRYLSTK